MLRPKRNNDEIYNSILDMDDYSKSQLITIAFLSCMMIDNKGTKYNEVKKLLRISRKEKVDLIENLHIKRTRIFSNPENGKEEYDPKYLAENDIISEIEPRMILDIMASFASDMGFFDTQPEIESLLAKYREELRYSGNNEMAAKSDLMKYTAKDNDLQFGREQTTVETYGNLAWLSNQFAHIFEIMEKEGTFKSSLDLRESFMRIKNYAMHGIIKEKKEGRADDVLLGLEKDLEYENMGNYGQYMFIALPRYLQPIRLHYHKLEFTQDEMDVCTDRDDFSYDYIMDQELTPTMPLKLSEEKESLLHYIYSAIYLNRTKQDGFSRRLDWYFDHNRPRKPLIKFNRKTRNIPVVIINESPQVKIKRENMDYITDVFEKKGLRIPSYMKNFLQTKSNYSYKTFEKKIRMIIRDKLHHDGLTYTEINEQMDNIYPDVFISMCMLKPMTSLSKMGTGNKTLIDAVSDSLGNREIIMSFIRENIDNFENMEEFRHSLRTEIKDSKEDRESRTEIAKLNARLKELNSQLTSKLEEQQIVSEQEATLENEIKTLRDQIKDIEAQIK